MAHKLLILSGIAKNEIQVSVCHYALFIYLTIILLLNYSDCHYRFSTNLSMTAMGLLTQALAGDLYSNFTIGIVLEIPGILCAVFGMLW